MKRKIAIALSMLLSISCLAGCKGSTDELNVEIPQFADSKGVIFTAYSGPTVEKWSGGSTNINTVTDEHFKKLSEAGFNRLISIHEGARVKIENTVNPDGSINADKTWANSTKRAEEDSARVLPLAEKYNIQYYVRDWAFYDMCNAAAWGLWDAYDTREKYETALRQMFSKDNQYMRSSAYCGNFGRDEPGVDQFERLKWQIEIYNEIMAEYGIEGEFLLNLLPSYGGVSSYGGVTYTEYVDRYFEELAPLLGYVSWDYYPFKRGGDGTSQMRNGLAANLAMMANKCKQGGYELRAFVQTGGDFTGLRDLTSIGDFRLQVYTNMAFGARQMTYYEYGTFNSQNEGDFGLINLEDGTYNYTYDLAKTVNNEVHAFEDAYMNFDWDGVMCFSSLAKGKINPKFKEVTPTLKSHPRIGEVEITKDALMGTFKDDEGRDAFMLVNYNDPYFNEENEVTIEFKDAKALLMYRLGKQEVVKLNKGKYTFKLYPGEGRFIIPLS